MPRNSNLMRLTRSPRKPFLLLLAALAATAAHAADGERGARDTLRAKFAAADANHDGYLDRAEAAHGMPRIGRHFDAADTDRDGKLSIGEVAAYIAGARAARK